MSVTSKTLLQETFRDTSTVIRPRPEAQTFSGTYLSVCLVERWGGVDVARGHCPRERSTYTSVAPSTREIPPILYCFDTSRGIPRYSHFQVTSEGWASRTFSTEATHIHCQVSTITAAAKTWQRGGDKAGARVTKKSKSWYGKGGESQSESVVGHEHISGGAARG